MTAATTPFPPTRVHDGSGKAITLALSLAQAERAILEFSESQVDAIVDGDGRAYLLRPAQESLRQNERRLRAIIDSAADVITVVDRDGRIVSQNRAVTRLLGYEPDELVGRSLFELVYEEDLNQLYTAFFNVIGGIQEKATVHFYHPVSDGSYRQMEATMGKLHDSGSECVILTSRLMPNPRAVEVAVANAVRQRADEEATTTRHYAEATIRTIPVPFLILRADLRVESASELFYQNFRVTAEEIEDRLVYELGNGQWDIPELRTLLQDIPPETATFHGYEVTHECHALGRRTMLLNARRLDSDGGKTERILLTIKDITARHEAEAAVRESEERYRALFEAVPVAVFVCNRAGVIQQYNQHAVEMWGREPARDVETYCGAVRLCLSNGFAIPDEERPILKVLRTGVPALNVELCIERPDGSHLPVLVNFAALKNAEGEVVGAVSSFVDITERKQAEEAVRVAIAEIERASSAKDDFLAALSHELRSPLTPVLLTATALESDPALPSEVREQLTMMCRNIELEARLIDDLLDLTRISRGKLQIMPVAADLHELLEHTAEIVRGDGLGKQVPVVFRLEAARHRALADPARLQQIFWNLLKNALKFTPAGGTVTVRTRNDAEGPILVSVEDTGIGIAAEALPLIFKAFEQGDIAGQHRYGGLGLGLAITRAIVEIHGGTIVAESEGPGRGAQFTVALATIDAPAGSMRASSPLFSPARALRLLIVEDHEATRLALVRLLTRQGHHITAASTAKEALAAFVTEHFDGVISDLGLPDGNGLDLMREIQRQRPVPAIALSGYGMEEDLRLTREAGFSAHLVKPVSLDQLRLLLDQLTSTGTPPDRDEEVTPRFTPRKEAEDIQ